MLGGGSYRDGETEYDIGEYTSMLADGTWEGGNVTDMGYVDSTGVGNDAGGSDSIGISDSFGISDMGVSDIAAQDNTYVEPDHQNTDLNSPNEDTSPWSGNDGNDATFTSGTAAAYNANSTWREKYDEYLRTNPNSGGKDNGPLNSLGEAVLDYVSWGQRYIREHGE